ncbi:hypothetical protein [Mesobacillus boroniphilus]|uniref:Uncharacterized protein n=1 Tax=Mesobacillus boroniphilus JCM 21738 TaxID=1294265 RepID=W4RLD2_9BACI|nr:hypothetical protein [Mesobacillus boroniphilus]GAE45131.1 hypothetical protein JCM21738_1904 [Mesobacillus boroniphilus JCM 21738]
MEEKQNTKSSKGSIVSKSNASTAECEKTRLWLREKEKTSIKQRLPNFLAGVFCRLRRMGKPIKSNKGALFNEESKKRSY